MRRYSRGKLHLALEAAFLVVSYEIGSAGAMIFIDQYCGVCLVLGAVQVDSV